MKKYTINDVIKIQQNGFEYEKNDCELNRYNTVITCIDSLPKTVWPTFKGQHSAEKVFSELSSSSVWKYECSTKKISNDDGLGGKLNEIRLNLNKISDKSFDSIYDKINNSLEVIIQINRENNNDIIDKISKCIFDIASQNKFYSKLYAKLYSNLLQKYPILENYCISNFNSYMSLFENIDYCNPDEDYEKYCEINKINNKRKSISSFFVNLVIFNVITKEALSNVLNNLISKFYEMVNQENMTNIVDEYVENIFILCDKNCIETNDDIERLPTLKASENKSLSNKSMFKLREINIS
tara:strand:- start:869 stop:1759 length:891 start_codon:yes stop_codon:yes gene_type:complete